MTKQSEQTEVVKIRLGSEDKVRLQEIAEKEFRCNTATVVSHCRPAFKIIGAACLKEKVVSNVRKSIP